MIQLNVILRFLLSQVIDICMININCYPNGIAIQLKDYAKLIHAIINNLIVVVTNLIILII
ncbi:MAG: hypothetical protein V6012_01270 [Candidatus Dasytiphilus stammeri]